MGAEDSGVELAILGFAALAAAVVGSLWLGATVACLVAGHGGLGVGLVGAARAVPGLASHPGSPARAWGPPASGRLPGSALYWVCTAPILAAALAAALLAGSLIARRRTVGLEKRSRMGLNPEARFARAKDLAPLWVRGPDRPPGHPGRRRRPSDGHRGQSGGPGRRHPVVVAAPGRAPPR